MPLSPQHPRIVTMTTDWGLRDYYVGAFKGELLRTVPDVMCIDISHYIDPFDVLQAAFAVRSSYKHFPPHSIHLVAVSLHAYADGGTLLVPFDQHWFVAADNGLLPLIWEGQDVPPVYRWVGPTSLHDSVWPHGVAAAAALAAGKPIADFTQATTNYRRLAFGLPLCTSDSIRGQIMYIDRFGNCMVNIRRELFEQVAGNRSFTLYFKRYDELSRCSNSYADVPRGNMLCFFNSAGWLEIAIHQGNAHKLLHLNIRDTVHIVFSTQ